MNRAVVTSLLAAFMWTIFSFGARGQASADPCGVLTDAEVGAAIGGSVAAHREQGDLTKRDRASCRWTTSSPKQGAALEIGRVAAGARVQNNDWVQQVTQLGWTVEVAESSPTLWCGRVVESPNRPAQALPGPGSRCEAVMKGFYFALDVWSPKVTAPQVKSLVEKIATRLP